MRYNSGYRSTSFFSSGYFPDGVKWLLISNVAIFVLSYLAAGSNFLAEVFPWLALRPDYVIHRLAIWQLATYLFLHGGVWHLLRNWGTRTIGASGAIYGLLLAFGVMYPDTTILFSFLFPIKAKYFVMIYGAIELLAALGTHNSGVSNIAHLGGMAFGFLYLKMRFPTLDLEDVRGWYRSWKMQRAKKKFQVYLRKQGSDRDRWVN